MRREIISQAVIAYGPIFFLDAEARSKGIGADAPVRQSPHRVLRILKKSLEKLIAID